MVVTTCFTVTWRGSLERVTSPSTSSSDAGLEDVLDFGLSAPADPVDFILHGLGGIRNLLVPVAVTGAAAAAAAAGYGVDGV